MAEREMVLGGFEVDTELRIGSEHLLLLFTSTRLILVHGAKLGRESMALSNILGRMAKGFRSPSKKRNLLEKAASLSPQSILALDRDNFAVGYDQVVSLTVKPEGFDQASLTLVTRDMKVRMSASLTVVQALRETITKRLERKVSFEL
jgi:hypothetical protein